MIDIGIAFDPFLARTNAFRRAIAPDSASLVQFSKSDRFELLMSFSEKGLVNIPEQRRASAKCNS
jgi:hypothetical protein